MCGISLLRVLLVSQCLLKLLQFSPPAVSHFSLFLSGLAERGGCGSLQQQAEVCR